MSSGIIAERVFADLCNKHFLRGFVFHSPRFFNPTESEAGDVVLWVRQQVVVFEVVVRDVNSALDTKQFVKRIGEKRDQLERDYQIFNDRGIELQLVNEQSEKVVFDKPDLANFNFMGVVIVDFNESINKLHFGTIKKTLALPFPVAVMSRQDFLDLTTEVDTVPDLTCYLHDRFSFLKKTYDTCPLHFLDLNSRFERQLIAFYKMNDNRFPVDAWNPANALLSYSKYTTMWGAKIAARDTESADSYVIDQLIDFVRQHSTPADQTLLHSWELASMTRRQRATWLAKTVKDAFFGLQQHKPMRYFAFFNQATACWLVFYFKSGCTLVELAAEISRFTKYKLFVEMKEREFQYSVFGYGFSKDAVETGFTVDISCFVIEDAKTYDRIPPGEYETARTFFGQGKEIRIREFPA